MNYKHIILAFFVVISFYSCAEVNKPSSIDKAKNEIAETEKKFEAMVIEKGISDAFYFYAAEDAVIKTKDTIITGREAIKRHYDNWNYKDVKLLWSPDYVDVSASCDLGYTYGKYIFNATDTSGKQIESRGVFHTVWKKQKDGNWKYVWD
jgi:ketosteroid isomerase-like protein